MTRKTATFIKKLDGTQGHNYGAGDARLYRLSEPIPFWDYGPNVTSTRPAGETTTVAVIAHGTRGVHGSPVPTTHVVPADAQGNENIDDSAFILELGGLLSHQKALSLLGFEVIGDSEEVDPDRLLEMANEAMARNTDFAGANFPVELEALLASSILDSADEEDDTKGTGTED